MFSRLNFTHVAALASVLAAMLLISPSASFAQECVDPDGDGYGWDGTRTCLVSPVPASVGSNAACIDSDGDGFGWDGTQSCVVSASQKPAEGPAVACLDPDGDGYGWDGQGTCVVGPPAGAADTGQPDSDEAGGECFDPDGDGWGWNGTSSCRVGGATEAPNPAAAPVSPVPADNPPVAISGAYNPQRDLIALHFDHAPDPDDGHAAVATKMVTDKLGLNVQVVAGTYGFYSSDRYVPASEPLMNIIWGSQWLNAHRNFDSAVNSAVNRWSAILGGGGSIWIAEGGPSDFTAEVIRRLQQRHSEFNTSRRVHLIQHSVWNEDHTLGEALNFVRANTNYIRIEDGNNPNSTADLRFESHNNGNFVTRALSSSYANEWAAAFDYLSPSEKLDFSDAVELLHILNIGTNVINDVNDFGDVFF